MGRSTDTQREAFREIQGNLQARESVVLSAILDAGQAGVTLFQLTERLGWPVNCVSGRVTKLRDRNLIFDTGARITNPASGRHAIVWCATRWKEDRDENMREMQKVSSPDEF